MFSLFCLTERNDFGEDLTSLKVWFACVLTQLTEMLVDGMKLMGILRTLAKFRACHKKKDFMNGTLSLQCSSGYQTDSCF